jgi:hypothetical protein
MQRYTNFGAAALDGMPSGVGPREILVRQGDLDAARELIESSVSSRTQRRSCYSDRLPVRSHRVRSPRL